VRIAAHLQEPIGSDNGIDYVPRRQEGKDYIANRDWGRGELVYISFSVEDTGTGLSAKDKKQLFHRFSQASPKTHVQYGGSGLGLFISRQISEMVSHINHASAVVIHIILMF
jgi:signal transduction histidine kinase